MTASVEQQVEALRAAVGDFRRAEVERICRGLVAEIHRREEPLDAKTAVEALKLLQRKRYIALVHDLAEALMTHGSDTVEVVHRYALALLDHDRTAVAAALLESLSAGVRQKDFEVAGAFGRVHKQRYVTSGPAAGARRAKDLARAIEAYGAAYRADPEANHYHGINAAAMLMRAARDGVTLAEHPSPAADARTLAQGILADIDGAGVPDFWQLATAAEACLALQRDDDAVDWVARYVGSDADAFEYASTLRQMQLVWELGANAEPGRRVLPLLRNRLLQTEGGTVSVFPDEFTPESLSRFVDVEETMQARRGTHYERVYGWDRFQPVAWLRQALTICRSIARIEDTWGNGCGTGFVLDGTKMGPQSWPRRVLLTNAHVVPEVLPVEDTYPLFEGWPMRDQMRRRRSSRTATSCGTPPSTSSTRASWHCRTILTSWLVPLDTRKVFPTLGTRARPRAYVIGHPLGSPDIQLSLHDTLRLAAGEVYAHYRSPTESGSSGSPVFDETWRVIALHHGATDHLPGTMEPANEGIRIDRLLAEIRAQP